MIKTIKHEIKRDVPKGPITEEGFEISKEFIQSCAQTMTRHNAISMKTHFRNCGTVLNRDVLLTMFDYKRLTFMQRLSLRLFKRYF